MYLELFPLFFHFIKSFFVDEFSSGDMRDFNQLLFKFFYITLFEVKEGDFLAKNIMKSSKLFDGKPMPFPQISISEYLNERKLIPKPFVRFTNYFHDFQDDGIAAKDICFKISQLLASIDNIFHDCIGINWVETFIELHFNVESVVFFETDELIVGHKLGFDFNYSLKIGADPFHGLFVLI